jgi:hypothetical protein
MLIILNIGTPMCLPFEMQNFTFATSSFSVSSHSDVIPVTVPD